MKIKNTLAIASLATTMFVSSTFNIYAGELTWVRSYVTKNYPNYTVERYDFNSENNSVQVYLTDKNGNTLVKFFSCDEVDNGKCYIK